MATFRLVRSVSLVVGATLLWGADGIAQTRGSGCLRAQTPAELDARKSAFDLVTQLEGFSLSLEQSITELEQKQQLNDTDVARLRSLKQQLARTNGLHADAVSVASRWCSL